MRSNFGLDHLTTMTHAEHHVFHPVCGQQSKLMEQKGATRHLYEGLWTSSGCSTQPQTFSAGEDANRRQLRLGCWT